MTPTQRAAALRLIEFETLPRRLLDIACRVRVNECLFHDDEFVDDASHALKEAIDLLRELLAEQWLTSAKLDACMASRDALRDWAQECRDQVLYLLAQRDDELGRLADGFGQASVALLRELLSEPQGEPVATLLEQSRQNCLRNFGPNGLADWIYNDLGELLADAAPQH